MHLEGKITLACDALYPLDVHRMMTNTEDGNVVGWCVNVCVCRGGVSLEQGVGITPASPVQLRNGYAREERLRERQTDRQTDRESERARERERERERD